MPDSRRCLGPSHLNRNLMFLLFFKIHYVRNVGVAGSNPVTPTIDFLMNFSSRRHLVSVSRAPWCSLGVNFDRKCSRETLRSDRSLRTPCVEMALRSAAARRGTELDSGHRYVAHTSDIWAVFADIWPICLDTCSIGRYMADIWPISI